MAAKHAEASWGKVDTDAERELASRYNVSGIPTAMLFRGTDVPQATAVGPDESDLAEMLARAMYPHGPMSKI